MLDELMGFLRPRSEEVVLGNVTLTVRELPSDAETQSFRDSTDSIYKWIVRCTFAPDGNPVWTDDQIPSLKAAPQKKLAPLMMAVARVNGWDLKGDEGNSSAAQSSG